MCVSSDKIVYNENKTANRPFAQLLPGLETGHPVTAGQSPAYDFSVSDEHKAVFLVSVSDRFFVRFMCR